MQRLRKIFGRNLIRSLLILQVLAALIYIIELVGELLGIRSLTVSWEVHELIELGTVISLLIGSAAAFYAMTSLARRNEEVESQLKVASGEFFEVLESRFDQWDLTIAEREVGLMSLKGFSVAEVAEMRGKSLGTIKAQNASLYRKAGVSGRAQLMASLMEDLLDNAVISQAGNDDNPVQ